MEICAVTSSFPRYKGDHSGIFVYNLLLAASKRHKVHVIYPTNMRIPQDKTDPLYRHEVSYPFKTYPLAQVQGWELIKVLPLLTNMARAIRRVKHQHSIDLFHAFWTIPGAFITSLCCGKTPLVTTLEGSDIKVFGRELISKLPIKYALKKSSRIIALSNELKREAIELGANEDKIYVIPDGVDTSQFKPMDKGALRARLQLPDGFLVLFAGSLFKGKRVDRLIKVSSSLSRASDFHVLIVGDGPERQKLEGMARSLGLNNILFKGQISHEDLPPYMATSDVLVLPSETEGLPTCVQEAMACGIPVVASNVGGLPDLVTKGVTGYLADDDIELEGYLKQLISSPSLTRMMGEKALDFARRNLALETVVEQIEQVYESYRHQRSQV